MMDSGIIVTIHTWVNQVMDLIVKALVHTFSSIYSHELIMMKSETNNKFSSKETKIW